MRVSKNIMLTLIYVSVQIDNSEKGNEVKRHEIYTKNRRF